eukprot:CAMPEP_0170548232 /NCGR_PEP_ID=MMETSP0211-20121228/6560_1 /TAXON_ID=311385 /ORGANISM="Pseudokeronopsis sp., Strain OXSARD2" /LENGTH=42 /DNA_ID= /DNA_START= /DNA_END= /DNA_ORIENTATION=
MKSKKDLSLDLNQCDSIDMQTSQQNLQNLFQMKKKQIKKGLD